MYACVYYVYIRMVCVCACARWSLIVPFAGCLGNQTPRFPSMCHPPFVPFRCETFVGGISVTGHLDRVCLMTRLFCRLPRLCVCACV
ncbi:uncharacterized protein LY79DRAFT_536012 [Colletotrichum navitas]|uniref:Uncharacterized protein n=1 Tax=Colletotrichum navitas TaxID=681940 RepID=A0AAD8QE36_9PEZI|nr:uncharacterized protein LY79DRAFT_536012 [Colletotrichum navitas]KAK1599757.1 hypothetical protein LY79DRAFT_536012 [Colletotrichum navitas]